MKLHTLNLTQAINGLQSKNFTSTELCTAILGQIKSRDKEFNAYVTVDGDWALKKAKEADNKLAKGEQAPLLGIPVSIKDNYSTWDIRTTASSKVLDNYIPRFDATVVARLKKAGAIILGKTNMDAWAHGSSR